MFFVMFISWTLRALTEQRLKIKNANNISVDNSSIDFQWYMELLRFVRTTMFGILVFFQFIRVKMLKRILPVFLGDLLRV